MSKTQNSFLDGWYIGESTIIVYNIMQFSEELKEDGLFVWIMSFGLSYIKPLKLLILVPICYPGCNY